MPAWFHHLRGVLYRASGGLTGPPSTFLEWWQLQVIEVMQSDAMTIQAGNAKAKAAGVPGVTTAKELDEHKRLSAMFSAAAARRK